MSYKPFTGKEHNVSLYQKLHDINALFYRSSLSEMVWRTWIDIYLMLLAVLLICYPVALGGFQILYYYHYYFTAVFIFDLNRGKFLVQSTLLRGLLIIIGCAEQPFTVFVPAIYVKIFHSLALITQVWLAYMLLEASPCQTSFSFHLRFVRPFTIGTFRGDNHHCSFLTFSAGRFDIQHRRTCMLVRMKNICLL